MRVPPDVVCVRTGSRKHSVVFLPGLGGPPSGMAALAARIGGPGSIYILDLLQLAEADGEPLTVESLARRGLAAVRDAGGADILVGYSFGGLVALEIAKLAQAAGDSALRPILIDSAPEQSHWPTAAWRGSLWRRTWQYARLLRSLSPKQAVSEFKMRTQGLVRRIRRRRAASALEGGETSEPATEVAPSAAVRMARAFALYRPSKYAGCLVLIESSDPDYAMPVSMIWRPLAAQLEVLRYSGGHLDAVRSEECLESLAALLNSCLGLPAQQQAWAPIDNPVRARDRGSRLATPKDG